MFTSDKHIKQEMFGNITDYSKKCPKGCRSFFAFVYFADGSECLYSNIFAENLAGANLDVFSRFADCRDYLTGYSLQEADK